MNPPHSDPSPDAFLIALRDTTLSLDEARNHVAAPECGGQVFFVGSVRPDETEDGEISALEYEAYAGVAETKMREIAEEVAVKFGVMRVAMLHRHGRLEPGDPAVVVAVGCGHRAEAFEACRYLIDELKLRVPIWKKEWTSAGGRWVDTSDTSNGAQAPGEV